MQRRQSVTALAGCPLRMPNAGRAFVIAAAVVPLVTASQSAAASDQGSSCQRSSCRRVLTRNQGGRVSRRASRLVRLAAARQLRNEARVSPAVPSH